ncbi:hypothetical protein BKA67DRAFT_659857 [Truncatella angustata]|uniref:Uncharacterized protein n=1 Tax=Truncatella angustata TaxID=152316 RepID=A0A9P8ZXP4_9PEZI|nr:uncharacterized protein BKA67DRAFT_659857 [Truncatella angustata]KAH6653223.1 hypothetical protein BKA67DRAFT_659857 [Truncatella angustata]
MAASPDGKQSSVLVQQSTLPGEEADAVHNHDVEEEEEEEEDCEDEVSEGDASSECFSQVDFPYTRDELAVFVSDFYIFLSRLCLPADALKLPPPGGWPNITPEATSCLEKTPFVVDLLKHLPYITDDGRSHYNRIHYKCYVVDYSVCSASDFAEHASNFEWQEEMFGLAPEAVEHSILLADGYESGGRMMLLNTKTGELHVEMIRYDTDAVEDVGSYLGALKRRYETLDMVPIPGEEHFDENVEEEEEGYETILEDQVMAQEKEEYFTPSKLDQRWVRHLYRSFGWPQAAYRKDEALAAVEAFRRSRRSVDDEL